MITEPGFSHARTAWGRFLYLRHRIFGPSGRVPRIVRIEAMQLVILPGVFDGVLLESGRFLAGALNGNLIPSGCRVLDMGTGSGIVAIRAAQFGARVTAVDINPEAVCCARVNVLLNRLEGRVCVVEGDLFEPVEGETFDRILFNPPFYRQTPKDIPDAAWRSTDAFDRFFAGLDRMLSAAGEALVLLSSRGDLVPAPVIAGRSWLIEAVAQKDVLHEVYTLYRVVRKP